MIKIGVSGSRGGMANPQYEKAVEILEEIRDSTNEKVLLHHGKCRGSDEQFNAIAKACGFETVAHPPTNPIYMSDCESDITLDPLPYLVRNKEIAREGQRLIATPKSKKEIGGTWHTIKCAAKMKKPVTIIWSDGSTIDYRI